MDQATMHERTETLQTTTVAYGDQSDQSYARVLQGGCCSPTLEAAIVTQ